MNLPIATDTEAPATDAEAPATDVGAPRSVPCRVRDRLAATFDTSFRLFRREGRGWIAEPPWGDEPAPGGPSTTLELAGWFDRLADDPASATKVRVFSSGRTVVGVATRAEDGSPIVVAGEVRLDPQRLAAEAASHALCEAEHQDRAVMQNELVDHYAVQLTESFEELSFLRRLTRHVEYCVADRPLIDAAADILPQLCDLLRIEGICLFEADADDDTVHPGERIGISGKVPGDRETWRAFIAGLEDRGRRVLVRNYFGVINRESGPPMPGVRSLVVAPIEKDGQVFGWLLGINKRPFEVDAPKLASQSLWPDEIGSTEASLLEAAAFVLGSHAANHRLFREKEALVVDVIQTLVGVIEARDSYTCGHSDRVALVARRLGEQLRLSTAECHDLFLSGLLHDIGKIGVADDVLLKPGKLSDEEFAQIKRHPETGAQLLRGLKPLEKLIPGVLHHHEAIDGSGYPGGLQGDEIPMMARILAVADAFDAMTSNRAYRRGMPVAKAESILRDGAGGQWDARVVDAFFAIRDDIADVGRYWQHHLDQLLSMRRQPAENDDAVNAFAALAGFGIAPGITEVSAGGSGDPTP